MVLGNPSRRCAKTAHALAQKPSCNSSQLFRKFPKFSTKSEKQNAFFLIKCHDADEAKSATTSPCKGNATTLNLQEKYVILKLDFKFAKFLCKFKVIIRCYFRMGKRNWRSCRSNSFSLPSQYLSHRAWNCGEWFMWVRCANSWQMM